MLHYNALTFEILQILNIDAEDVQQQFEEERQYRQQVNNVQSLLEYRPGGAIARKICTKLHSRPF